MMELVGRDQIRHLSNFRQRLYQYLGQLLWGMNSQPILRQHNDRHPCRVWHAIEWNRGPIVCPYIFPDFL